MPKNTLRHITNARHTRRFIAIALPVLLLVSWIGINAQQEDAQKRALQGGSQKRTLEVVQTHWPKGILELVAVNNLQSEEFPKGFGLVVKNISDKPIYFLKFTILFPYSKPFLQNVGSMSFYYGPHRLVSFDNRVELGDTPLNPGETHTFTVDEQRARNFFAHLTPTFRANLREQGINYLKLSAQVVNFGDGTGYLAGSPYPVVRDISGVLQKVESGCGSSDPMCFESTLTNGGAWCNQPVEYGPCPFDTVGNGGGGPCKLQVVTGQDCGCNQTELDDCPPLAS